MSNKVKVIGTIPKLLFKAVYPFGSKKVDNFFEDGTFGDKAAMGAAVCIDKTVDVLSDDIAENKAQVQAVWVGYLRETLLPAIGDEVKPAIAKIASAALEALLVSLAEKVLEATALLLDDIKDNPEQLKAFAQEYLKSDEFRALVLAWVNELVSEIEDEALQTFFIVAANGLFDFIQGKTGTLKQLSQVAEKMDF